IPGRQWTPGDGRRGRAFTVTTAPATRSTASASSFERDSSVVIRLLLEYDIRVQHGAGLHRCESAEWLGSAPEKRSGVEYNRAPGRLSWQPGPAAPRLGGSSRRPAARPREAPWAALAPDAPRRRA